MSFEVTSQLPRDTFIKQKSHGQVKPPSPALTRRWLALLLRLENFRETHPEFRLLRDNLEGFGRAHGYLQIQEYPQESPVAMHDWFLSLHKRPSIRRG
jgi:hypothetical protein